MSAQYRVILVADVERFGSRSDPKQLWLRRQVYDIVETAAAECGIDLGKEFNDQGDGAFWLLSGDVPKKHLTGRFITHLHAGLLAYAQVSSAEGALRLRVALHAGDVTRDGRGWAGTDLITACRLVDLQALRDALAAAPRSCLVLGVSEDWYRAVIRHDDPEVERQAFRAVPFHVKEVDDRAWIRVPGYDTPPGLDALTKPATPDRSKPDPDRAAPQPDPQPNTAAFSSFAGATFPDNQGTIYGGHHYDHGPEEKRR